MDADQSTNRHYEDFTITYDFDGHVAAVAHRHDDDGLDYEAIPEFVSDTTRGFECVKCGATIRCLVGRALD